MIDKDSLNTEKAQKSENSAKIKAGELPLNHREIDRLKNTVLARQQAYRRIISQMYIFRQHGSELTGTLYPSSGYNGLHQKVYPVEMLNKKIVLIPGNKHLQRIFDKFKLEGKTIRIVYVGDKWTHSRHKMKIYEVYDMTDAVKRRGFSPAIAKAISQSQSKTG